MGVAWTRAAFVAVGRSAYSGGHCRPNRPVDTIFFLTRRKASRRICLRDVSRLSFTSIIFRAVYFPWPGCITSGVTFHPSGGSSDSPLTIKAQTFRIRGHYAELLLRPHYVRESDLEGLRVLVPVLQHGTGSPGSSSMNTQDSKITVGQIVADGSVLEVARSGGKQPDEFVIHQLLLESVRMRRAGCHIR